VKEFISAGQPTAELESVLKNLSARGLAEFVKVDYNVIRGLAYYTGVVFEAFDKQGELRAVAAVAVTTIWSNCSPAEKSICRA
jgi:histidyl-tRNA synthetase